MSFSLCHLSIFLTFVLSRLCLQSARLRQYDELVDERNLIESAKTSGKLILPPGPRLGKVVFECINLTKAVDGRTLLRDVSFYLPPGAILGVVGPNGTGKSTLF